MRKWPVYSNQRLVAGFDECRHISGGFLSSNILIVAEDSETYAMSPVFRLVTQRTESLEKINSCDWQSVYFFEIGFHSSIGDFLPILFVSQFTAFRRTSPTNFLRHLIPTNSRCCRTFRRQYPTHYDRLVKHHTHDHSDLQIYII